VRAPGRAGTNNRQTATKLTLTNDADPQENVTTPSNTNVAWLAGPDADVRR
jgi:hypothetical protein